MPVLIAIDALKVIFIAARLYDDRLIKVGSQAYPATDETKARNQLVCAWVRLVGSAYQKQRSSVVPIIPPGVDSCVSNAALEQL